MGFPVLKGFEVVREIDPGVVLLHDAAERVLECEDEYGPASKTFALIAARWSLVVGVEVTPAQVAIMMIDLKLARLTGNLSHRDSQLDVAGYVACLHSITEGE